MPEQVHPLLLIEVHMLAFPVNSNQLQWVGNHGITNLNCHTMLTNSSVDNFVIFFIKMRLDTKYTNIYYWEIFEWFTLQTIYSLLLI
jgi:hypothetical protein